MRRTHWIILTLALIVAIAALLAGILAPMLSAPLDEQSDAEPSSLRIVTLSPAIAVILADLGLEDSIVGRHAYDIALDSSIPIVGDINGIDYERLLRLKPTHILLERSAQPLPGRLLVLADDNGWTVKPMALLALDDIPLAAEQLTRLFETPQVRQRMSALLKEFNASMSPNQEAAALAGRVLPLFWTNPPGAAGPGSFHYEMLERLGFELALTEGGPYITVDPEDILRMDPDSILLLMPGADPERLDELLGPLSNLDLRCVREGRVGVISDPRVNLPATSITGVVENIAQITSEWAPPNADAAN